MNVSEIKNWAGSCVLNALPAGGAAITALGAGWASEGDYEEGAQTIFLGMGVTYGTGLLADTGGFSEEYARANHDTANHYIFGRGNQRMKLSAFSAAAGASIHGVINVFSGLRNLDLKQAEKGALQFAIGNIGARAIASSTPATVTAVNGVAATSFCLYQGVKNLANRQWMYGARWLSFGFLVGTITTLTDWRAYDSTSSTPS